MSQAIAFENGSFREASEISLPVFDQGFVQGVTVAEQLRTFGGKLFRFEDHIARLRHSLSTVQVDCRMSDQELLDIATRLIDHNHKLLDKGDDLGLCLFVTPGPYPAFAASPGIVSSSELLPRVVAHTFPIPFGQWADKYETGQTLAISKYRQVPTECWPAELKCRSRMHYYLADLDAAQRVPGSRALLLDMDGAVCESSTANVFAYFEGEGFVAPPSQDVLPGISLSTVEDLARKLSVPFSRRVIMPDELKRADEVLLCSTSPCVLPVTEIDGQPISDARPGERFAALLEAWNELVGLDIANQAATYSVR